MRSGNAKKMAMGGVFAALAVVIMCMGGLIPVATFVCPVLCTLLTALMYGLCGSRTAWVWYAAVAILSLLMGPDKEAAFVFVFLGYYPILKPRLDRLRFRLLWKLLLFNAAIAAAYFLLLRLLGLEQVASDYASMGIVMTAVMLLLGNVTFFLLDKLLGRSLGRKP